MAKKKGGGRKRIPKKSVAVKRKDRRINLRPSLPFSPATRPIKPVPPDDGDQ